MLINQYFNAKCKAFNSEMINLAKLNRVVLMARYLLGFALLFATAELMMAAPRDTQSGTDDAPKSQPSNSKSTGEAVGVNLDDNIRLRRDLDDYTRTVDPAHVQIEERRRVMHKRLQERFSQTDRDNDGTISLEEAYETMPQLARHFGEVDLNSDRGITLEELEALQAKIAERQRVVAIKADAVDADQGKRKNKDGNSSGRKSAL